MSRWYPHIKIWLPNLCQYSSINLPFYIWYLRLCRFFKHKLGVSRLSYLDFFLFFKVIISKLAIAQGEGSCSLLAEVWPDFLHFRWLLSNGRGRCWGSTTRSAPRLVGQPTIAKPNQPSTWQIINHTRFNWDGLSIHFTTMSMLY